MTRELISNVWIINKKNSLCILQSSFGEVTKIDKDLFGGFITAFFNFSEEISGEAIKSVTMGSFKFFYQTTESIILTISTDSRLDENDIAPLMENIMSEFSKQGYEEKLSSDGLNENIFKPFAQILDTIIINATDGLKFILDERQAKGIPLKVPQKVIKPIETPLLKAMKIRPSREKTKKNTDLIRDNIVETLENAEYAINNSEYNEATIYYGVAAGLLTELGEKEKAEACYNFAKKSKEMAKYKNDLNFQDLEKVTANSTSLEEVDSSLVKIVPIIDEQLIKDEKIKEILGKAYQAEYNKKYPEAITYYYSASGLLILRKDVENSNKCTDRIKELVKKQKLRVNKPDFIENEIFFEEEVIPNTASTLEEETSPKAFSTLEEETNTITYPVLKEEASSVIFPSFESNITEEPEILKNKVSKQIEIESITTGDLFPEDEIKFLLENAELAEKLEIYDKSLIFYSEAMKKFTIKKDTKNVEKYQIKINEINKKIRIEEKNKKKEPEEVEEKLLIPEKFISDPDIKNFLTNAALAEKLELHDKAINFYSEAAEKFALLKESTNSEICRRKITAINNKILIEDRIKNFVPIIPLRLIDDKNLRKNLKKAYDAESQKKFNHASLFYNIASGLFLNKHDKENSEKCSKRAQELAELSKKLKN